MTGVTGRANEVLKFASALFAAAPDRPTTDDRVHRQLLVKVRKSRGENWLLANCNVATVSENVNDVTVISELAIASSRVRAAPGSPSKITALIQDGNV